MPLLMVVLYVTLVLAGTVLVYVLTLRGIRGRRVGADPHCPGCDYLLVGIKSGQCPECGAAFTAESIVHGERRLRRRTLAVAGAAVALTALAGVMLLLPAIKRVDWYHYKPAAWVMEDFLSPAGEARALAEMNRRDLISPISDANRNAIIERALVEQAAPTLGRNTKSLLEFLGRQWRSRRVTPEQQQRFFQNAGQSALSVGKYLLPYEADLAFRFDQTARLPDGFWVSFTPVDLLADGGSSSWRTFRQRPIANIQSQPLIATGLDVMQEPGEHRLEIKFRFEVYEGTLVRTNRASRPVATDTSQLLFSEERSHSTTFRVEPPDVDATQQNRALPPSP